MILSLRLCLLVIIQHVVIQYSVIATKPLLLNVDPLIQHMSHLTSKCAKRSCNIITYKLVSSK